MREQFRVTWETVTEESAEHGETSDSGFMVGATFGAYRGEASGPAPGWRPHGFTLRDALRAVSEDLDDADLESAVASDSDYSAARWVSWTYRRNGGSHWAGVEPGDPERVTSETRALHIPDSATPSSRARIVRACLEFS